MKVFFSILFLSLTLSIQPFASDYPIGGFKLIKNQFLGIKQDITSITTYPFKHKKKMLHFSLATLGLVVTDYQTTDFIQDHINPATESSIFDDRPFEIFPISAHGEYFIGFSAGLYTLSLLQNNNKGQLAGLLLFKAGTYSYLYSHLFLKAIIGRKRPAHELDDPLTDPVFTKNPYDFGHTHEIYFDSRSDATAMPSFHVTLFFSAAKVLQRVYNNYWIPYTLCALALIPNFEGHHHWTSDMFAGAMIGTIIGNQIANNAFNTTSNNLSLISHDTLSLTPLLSTQSYGVMLKKSF